MTKPIVVCALIAGCATSGAGPDVPLISPPVEATTPASLHASPAPRLEVVDATLEARALRDRFFSGSGATDVMTILGSIDQRLLEINRAGHRPACLDQPPVRYTITPFDHTVSLYAQCFRRFERTATGDAGFLQFGERGGRISLYVAVGATRFAAILSPIEGSTEYMIDAWYGVGSSNAACGTTGAFDGCSYAVTGLYANPVSKAFEMAVAGIGVGFCGVQFGSDGASLYGIGSIDMGTSCHDITRLCVSATDPEQPGACSTWPAYVLPAIGRKAGAGVTGFAASRYPVQPNITLDGTESDSMHFGPLAPTEGAGDFDATP